MIIMAEGKWHKKIRFEKIKEYKNKGYEVKSSHGNGKIPLYIGNPSTKTFLSDADIVLIKNERIIKIIEIQSTISPKQATGIITATKLCNLCKVNGIIYDLSNLE